MEKKKKRVVSTAAIPKEDRGILGDALPEDENLEAPESHTDERSSTAETGEERPEGQEIAGSAAATEKTDPEIAQDERSPAGLADRSDNFNEELDDLEGLTPEEKFNTLLAEELRKAPPPPRYTEPFKIGLALTDYISDLPAGAIAGGDVNGEITFLASRGGEEIDYPYQVRVEAPATAVLRTAIDQMITAGRLAGCEHDGVEVYLHAVQGHDRITRIPGQQRYSVELKYIFRVRPVKAEADRR